MSDSKSEIKIGDSFPTDVKVYEQSPVEAIDLKKIFDGQKVVVFAVPGGSVYNIIHMFIIYLIMIYISILTCCISICI